MTTKRIILSALVFFSLTSACVYIPLGSEDEVGDTMGDETGDEIGDETEIPPNPTIGISRVVATVTAKRRSATLGRARPRIFVSSLATFMERLLGSIPTVWRIARVIPCASGVSLFVRRISPIPIRSRSAVTASSIKEKCATGKTPNTPALTWDCSTLSLGKAS